VFNNPAKTLNDVPSGVRIRIIRRGSDRFDILLEAGKGDSAYQKRYGASYRHIPAFGLFEVNVQILRIEPHVFCIHSRATEGYGPLIYDIAIEFVTSMDCSLVSGSLDPHAISMSWDSAYAVWKKYLERDDVYRTPLTKSLNDDLFYNIDRFNDKRDPTPFMFSYQKSPRLLFSNRITYNKVVFAPSASRYLKSVLA